MEPMRTQGKSSYTSLAARCRLPAFRRLPADSSAPLGRRRPSAPSVMPDAWRCSEAARCSEDARWGGPAPVALPAEAANGLCTCVGSGGILAEVPAAVAAAEAASACAC